MNDANKNNRKFEYYNCLDNLQYVLCIIFLLEQTL